MEFNATFLISSISFIVFVLIMNKVLYAPISEIVAKRQAYLEGNAAEAAKNQEIAQGIIAEKQEKIADTKAQSKTKVAAEMEKNKQTKIEAAQTKKAEMDEAVSNHKKSLEEEKSTLSGELEGHAQEIAKEVLGKIGGVDV